MKNRLIELIRQARKKTKDANSTLEREMIFAEHFLANGGIVTPYKRGTIVYVVRSKTSNGKNLYMREERIDHYRVFDERVFMCFERGEMSVADYMWEESVFLTKEEAEAALKGGAE
jgi:hypothetical protein